MKSDIWNVSKYSQILDSVVLLPMIPIMNGSIPRHPWINFPQLSDASAIIAPTGSTMPIDVCIGRSRYTINEGYGSSGGDWPRSPCSVLLPRYSRHRVIYWPSFYCGPYLGFAMLALYEGNIVRTEIKRPIKSSKSIAWKLIPCTQTILQVSQNGGAQHCGESF